MKKIITLILAMVLLCSCLAGCGAKADLTGRWVSVVYYDSESVVAELEALEFYPEEIELIDASSMGLCDVVEFHDDMSYVITSDAALNKALVADFYRGVFETLYENREKLQDLYGEDFVSMNENDFYSYYAQLYGAADFDALIDLFAGEESDYAYLEEDAEFGTYRLYLNRVYFTIAGTATEEYVTFSMDGENTLTLDYNDSTVTYTKAQ